MMTESLGGRLLTLVILAVPVACVTWTVIHEEVFREVREYFGRKSPHGQASAGAQVLLLVHLRILRPDRYKNARSSRWCSRNSRSAWRGWRGCILAGFGLVWLANVYMALFGAAAHSDIKHEVREIAQVERRLEKPPPARPSGAPDPSTSMLG